MANTQGWQHIGRAYQNRQYRTYQLGRFVFVTTAWMYRVALAWIVWDLTHSATWVGLLALMDQAPAFLIMPLAGALADRTDSLRFMRITQVVLLVQALSLSSLLALGWVNVWVILPFALLNGAAHAAQHPPSQAVLPSLVTREEMATAYGLNSLTFNISRFIGPMLAGLVIEAWGPDVAILCNTLGAGFFSVCLAVLHTTHGAVTAKGHDHSGNMFTDIRDGVRYAAQNKGLASALTILTGLAVAPGAIELLLPSLADGVYKEGADGLGKMSSAIAVGAMMLALYLARRGSIDGLTNFVLREIYVIGAAIICLSLAPTFWVALICLPALGFGASGVRMGFMTLLQYGAEPKMRARVASFIGIIFQAGPAVGALVLGAAIDVFGTPPVFFAAGVVALVVAVLAARRRDVMIAALETEPTARAAAEKAATEAAAAKRAAE